MTEQLQTLHMGLCYTVSPQRMAAAEALIKLTGLNEAFFTIPGAEAVETALMSPNGPELEARTAPR